MWTGPGLETKSLVPKYTTVRPVSPEQTEKQGLFDHITTFDEMPGYHSWGRNSPQSTPPALEEQPMNLITQLSIDFPDTAHEPSMIYHSNPSTPPSDGGYEEGTMTQENMDRWSRSVTAKFAEGSSDSVRPSPPSSPNGEEINQATEYGSDLISADTNEISMDDPHTTLHDIDI